MVWRKRVTWWVHELYVSATFQKTDYSDIKERSVVLYSLKDSEYVHCFLLSPHKETQKLPDKEPAYILFRQSCVVEGHVFTWIRIEPLKEPLYACMALLLTSAVDK
jgi:hypothetical protein